MRSAIYRGKDDVIYYNVINNDVIMRRYFTMFIQDLNSNAMFRYEPQRFSKRIAAFDANHQTCTRIPDYPQGGVDSSLAGRREPMKKEKRNIGCCSKSKSGDAPWRLYNTDR